MDLAMPAISIVAATGGTSGLRAFAGIHGLERRDDKGVSGVCGELLIFRRNQQFATHTCILMLLVKAGG